MNPKKIVKPIFQRVLGLHAYLVLHSIFVALTMKLRPQEGEVLQFIKLLKPDDVVLDIGANVGAMSVLFAKACPEGSIFAFEPIPANFRALRTVLKMFNLKSVSIFPWAIGEKPDVLKMVVPQKGGSIMEGLSHVLTDQYVSEGETFDVQCTSLDTLSTQTILPGKVNAIKIDVENYEVPVILGALKLIERDRPLIYCEIWDADNRGVIQVALAKFGYTVHVAVHDHLEHYNPVIHTQVNLLFLPDFETDPQLLNKS